MTYQDPYRAQQQWQPVAVNPNPVFDHGHSPVPPRRVDPALVFGVIGFIMLGIVAVLVAAYMLYALGPTAAVIASLMALVPLAIVILVITWIDRWEPEPRLALLFAFLWGAAASVAIALIFSFGAQIVLSIAGIGPSGGTDFFSAVVQAPIVEETAKGVGVLLLFWAYRKHFDGPVDGLVYAATVAVGFAFTENIQYFGIALAESDLGSVAEVFFLRAILSPFAHVMFTAATGVALGVASRRVGAGGAIGYFILGLIPAVALHAFWNGASFLVRDFYGYYIAVQVPFFVIAVLIVVYLRRQEQRVTAARLAEYASVGWFTPAEVVQLSTGAGRSQGRAWAARHRLGPQFSRFLKDATRLAFARQRIVSSRDRIGGQRAEAELLARITADRRALAALPPLTLQR